MCEEVLYIVNLACAICEDSPYWYQCRSWSFWCYEGESRDSTLRWATQTLFQICIPSWQSDRLFGRYATEVAETVCLNNRVCEISRPVAHQNIDFRARTLCGIHLQSLSHCRPFFFRSAAGGVLLKLINSNIKFNAWIISEYEASSKGNRNGNIQGVFVHQTFVVRFKPMWYFSPTVIFKLKSVFSTNSHSIWF